ncbi:histidinol dehydrogenase [Dehalobacterium formicoaceticum]|uniref:Histidinol dehydrogenase n=1 Tax=Dehalobacterium formicoaceticum TaxID=51515 RepID=A0ABT1Y7M3_9FIRM|nr:histidinol dehydrogenase [Dehalobacterium formicoaceticum]MCR6546884.1 histidinol dehydrogenase [Dehalobacterium formicoaceticum]
MEDQGYRGLVEDILENIKVRGDQALIEYSQKFDCPTLTLDDLLVKKTEIEAAYAQVDEDYLLSLRMAMDQIRRFHEKQRTHSWMEPDEKGSITGQIYRPLERVGVYVPGGTASYPSSVMMNVLPAQVAGVEEIIMVTPPGKDGTLNPYTLVAAQEAGVQKIYKIGGAQAIAALAYGTDTIPKVDKITGPGNIFVTIAKKMVYGTVDIDMLAGPSEILVVADEKAKPEFLAADLLSQAEHDVLATALLVTTDGELALQVQQEVEKQLQVLSRREIAEKSINDHGAIILTADLKESMEIANLAAPEHLELMVEKPFEILGLVKNAGAVFLGAYAPEPVGDYWAGPNHILPTGGTARFYSPVTVDTFMKKTSVIYFTKEKLQSDGAHIIRLAEKEGLTAHAQAVQVRMKD